jgi:hypothetical protein
MTSITDAFAMAETYVPPGEIPEVAEPKVPPANSPLWGTLVGDFVQEVSPLTEADKMNTGIQFLTMLSAYIRSYAYVSATKHPANIFSVVVGPTASSHKGDAERLSEAAIHAAMPESRVRKVKGVSSGEGVIYHLRDGVLNEDTDIIEGGVNDKRLLIVETEFARLLKVMTRSGSTVSPVLRQAYDGGTLQTLTKNSTDVATDTHIGVIGHITAEELRSDLNAVEMANGLGNRFLWVYSTRAQVLPNPGVYEPSDHLVRELRFAISHGLHPRLVQRSTEADAYWSSVYPHLTEPEPGLIGSMTARNAPHALRLSVLFATLRRSDTIETEDIEAAIEVVSYSTQTVRWLFEASGLSPKEKVLVDQLMAAPGKVLTRSQIRTTVFFGHCTVPELNSLRDGLASRGIIAWEKQPTGGADREVWRLK